MVAGPPVEVQVRVLDWSSKAKLVTLGEPGMNIAKENKKQLACEENDCDHVVVQSQ